MTDQNLLLRASVRQPHVLMEGASERRIRRWQSLGLREVSDAQHLGELYGIASVVLGARQVSTLAVALGSEWIDQPPGQPVLVRKIDVNCPDFGGGSYSWGTGAHD